jgi:outer membrane immunogenic protein
MWQECHYNQKECNHQDISSMRYALCAVLQTSNTNVRGKSMRRSIALLAVTATLAASSAALAADMGIAPPPVVAPPVLSWTGFYVGVHGGYGWSNFNEEVQGWVAGGQIGYNYQFANRFVFGIEADFSAADIGQTVSDTVFGATITAGTNIDFLGTVRGRIGYGFERALVYATGGAAFAHHELSGSVTIPPVTVAFSDDQRHFGWTVGGGVEFMLTPNFTAKGEYLFSSFGEQTYFAGTLLEITGGLEIHTVKLGLNYLFK